MTAFTHIDEAGNACMVDVSDKAVTAREATAAGTLSMSTACFDAVVAHTVKKGDVLGVAQVGGIMGAKRTSELIPLCHIVPLTHCQVVFSLQPESHTIEARCTTRCSGQTGVEMEALTGVSTALLTLYDMCKALDKRMVIKDIHLVEKSGGRSGHFTFTEGGADHA